MFDDHDDFGADTQTATNAEGKKIPRLYMTCGDNDFLLQTNKRFLAFLEEKKVPVTFVPGEGVHDFVFWNKAIGPAVEWALGGK